MFAKYEIAVFQNYVFAGGFGDKIVISKTD
mgnify:CR=1 FL=1